MPDEPRLTHTPAWAKGMRKVACGLYVDTEGRAHLSSAEICERFGVPCSHENAEVILRAYKAAVQNTYGREPLVIEVDQ